MSSCQQVDDDLGGKVLGALPKSPHPPFPAAPFLGSHWAPPLGEVTSLRTLPANAQGLQEALRRTQEVAKTAVGSGANNLGETP